MATLNLGVLVSGRGSNLQAILDAIAERRLAATVRVVVSNQESAPALGRAAQAGVATRWVPHQGFASREQFDAELVRVLREYGVDWVVLAGFMRVLSPVILRAFEGHVINIHPALLPAFPGLHAQRQALAYGVKISGCTVHLVDEGVDTGPILAQRAVPVQDDDDEDTLSARILDQEHALLVSVLAGIADGSLRPDRARRRSRPE